MSTQLTTAHPPCPTPVSPAMLQRSIRERMSRRLALALIAWGRRTSVGDTDPHERALRRREAHEAHAVHQADLIRQSLHPGVYR
ncbi:hypothetical protein [Agromyces seonyuensis]|uniref:Uncharacterized protein n=1 Tax=Agromyces seonyuensis TaxID=2662446 RepID=A0A6I4P2M1_9MICO|nr:hypothetical protein [Agromyces seonyuensis]MWB97454.1 hypothetical protein [Agromyces seonyuensis]